MAHSVASNGHDNAAAMLDVQDITTYYGNIQALKGVSLTVDRGEVVCLIGSNGAGKTTTLRAIAGVLPISAGRVRLDGRRIDRLRPSTIARAGITLVPEGRGVFGGMTVEQNLRIAHRANGRERRPWHDWLGEVTTTFPRLGERLTQPAGLLSGGEQQMLAMARALVGDPRVLLFDELSMGLAPLIVEQLFDEVASLRAEGRTIVLVEQYLTYALRHADICYVLAKGRIAWCGEPGELKGSSTMAALVGG
jgi:branched-chain amino acid transport system ATP-binding protein